MIWSFFIYIFISLHPPAAPKCTPVSGWEDQVLSKENVRWITIGELHGTNETPDIFYDVVCSTSQSRRVSVALEVPVTDQKAVDAFIVSDGGDEATESFLKAGIWTNPIKDGRSSEAYFRLFESLRKMYASHTIENVLAIQPSGIPADAPRGFYEQEMAKILTKAATPEITVVALVGNVHAMRTEVPWPPQYMAMIGLLPSQESLSFDTSGDGGESWNCHSSPQVCGPISTPHIGKPQDRRVEMTNGPNEMFSGIIYLGQPTTASPPRIVLEYGTYLLSYSRSSGVFGINNRLQCCRILKGSLSDIVGKLFFVQPVNQWQLTMA